MLKDCKSSLLCRIEGCMKKPRQTLMSQALKQPFNHLPASFTNACDVSMKVNALVDSRSDSSY